MKKQSSSRRFQEIIDYLLSILAVAAERDMHPIVACLWVLFPNQLVKLAMGLDPLKPPLALLDVAIDAEVCRLATHVLGIVDTAHGSIQCETPVAASDFDGMPHRLS